MTIAPSSYDPHLFAIEDRHFWFRARNRIISTLVKQITAALSPGYRVLEVGCGTGNVLCVLQQVCTGGAVVGLDLFEDGLKCLQDAYRSGKPRKYDQNTERRILKTLEESPPEGYITWTGELVAKRLGDVDKYAVWRVLRKHGIQLQRRRSWCISTDPEFTQKAADIVGLYLEPPENAVVLSVDEKPAIQALERAQGWLRLTNGKALTGFHGIKTYIFTIRQPVLPGLIKLRPGLVF